MLKEKMRKILVTFTLLFMMGQQITPLYSQDFGATFLPSIEWQKQELEENINKKLINSLKPIIKSNEYLIDIQIEAKVPEKPEFNKTDEEAALDAAVAESDAKKKKEEEGKTEEEKVAEANKAEEEKKKKENKNKVRISDVDPKDIPEDAVLFSKLGLEAPLIDDFNDFQPDGKIILSMKQEDPEKDNLIEKQKEKIEKAQAKLDESKTKEDSLRKKLQALKTKPKPSAVEQLWKYNESVDIFKNLKSVKVKVQLNEELAQDTRDTISTVLNSINFNLGKVKPQIAIEYVNMKEKFKKDILPSKLKDIIDYASKFSVALGLLLSALLMGLVAFVIFRMYKKMKENEQAQAAAGAGGAGAGGDSGSDDDDEDEDDMGGAFSMGGEDMAGGLNGIERFRTFLSKNEVDASMLIKKWIKSAEKEEQNALRAVVQQLDNSELVKIFDKLTPDERAEWKKYLNKSVDGDGLIRANVFISTQIVEEIIVPAAITDPETQDLLLKIKPEQAAKFVQENPDLGKILMNVMNTKFVSKIIDNLDNSYIDNVIDSSIEFDNSEIESNLDSFKSKLGEYQDEKKRIPFLERVAELIPIASPSRETSLFKALAKSGDEDGMYNLASQYFPAVLVPELPINFLKTILQKYSMGPKIEMLLSIDESLKDHFVGIFAPEGSKANDMLQLEFEKAENDISVQRRVRENGEDIWKEFVDFSRKEIKNDKTVAGDIDSMVSEWVGKVCKGQSPEQAAQSLEASGEKVAA
ncbi:MAG: hypothetical protein KC493_05340 [Bacteriovoracaceae bacterium]|nr:hypothetical protein [Bacteriovoracaceae bacterium]